MLVLLSEYLAEAVGVLITETRKRAQRLMSALLESPSRDSRSSAGVLTMIALRVMIAEVRRACIHVCVRWVLYCCGWCESRSERRVF